MRTARHKYDRQVTQHIVPATYSSTQTPGSGVDLANFEEALVEVNVGAVTNDDFSIEVQESSDDGDTDAYAAVADADLDGTELSALTANTITEIAYTGTKRFIRVVATDGGTGDATFGVNVVATGARVKPTS